MVLKKFALAAVLLATTAMPGLAGKADDTLNWATDREVSVVDPYYNTARELLIMGHMGWDGLILLNPDSGDYEPLLATSWEWKGNTAVEFDLREGVKFHDGSDFDADDVVYTVNFISNEDNGVLTFSQASWMKEAIKLDKYKVRIELHEPYPNSMAYLSNEISIVPEGHYDDAPKGPDGKPDYGAVAPVGAGPYKMTELKSGEYVLWERFEDYYEGGAKGTPQIGKIKFRAIKENNTQIAELLTGGLDWIWDVPKEQALRMADSGQVQVVNAKTLRISYLSFDVDGSSGQDFFTNKLVRQAVAHAINREAIAENLVGPASVVINSACHPEQFGCTDDVPKWDYDPEKSKALLAEAGYPDGFTFDLYAYREREFTEAVIGDLANVGIRANLNYLQYSKLVELVWEGVPPLHHMTWGSSSIPDVAAITSHFFSGGQDDPAMDPRTAEALKRGDTTIDPKEREAAYAEALSIISGELYWLPMFTYTKYYAFSNDLDFVPTSDEIPRFYSAKWK
ncbi:ABC transporter substrate-binding protein [Roseovarius arcticus]|uniref:ABC transporter substrate-binding protein n=1 Tax=Roseovarius arcticus TaxID=2547404 RepID=UPI001BB2CCD0|nr:ABC transporter substrate-binding protein [Roseovarius arcticus]